MAPADSASRAGAMPEASGDSSSGTLDSKMNPRLLNGLVCAIGIFLFVLSFVGMATAMSSASVIGGASAKSPEAYPAIKAMDKNVRREWFWCRIAGGTIVVLAICIDLQLARKRKI